MLDEINETMQSQFNDNFYTKSELENMGFKKIGDNVLISRLARFYGIKNISIGSNVRIDDFAILSGNITLGNFIHISANSGITGGSEGVEFGDFCGISSYSKIFSSTDDFNGGYLVGPCIPLKYRNVKQGRVTLKKHNHIGSHSLVLPNSYFEIGSTLGPMSLNMGRKFKQWTYYFGNPAKKIYDINSNVIIYKERLLIKEYYG